MMNSVQKLTSMNKSELKSIDHLLKETEIVRRGEKARVFNYKLDDKAAKGKLVKGARRIPFEVAANSTSSNLVFNLGAWNHVVQPSLRYFNTAKGSICKVGDTVIRIADIKTGKDASGKHIDTQVIFFIDRDKV